MDTQQLPTIPQPMSQQHPEFGHGAPKAPPARDGLKSIISTILLIVAAPLIALLLINFVFQSYEVDGPSMETTLQNGDRLIVLKTGKTWARITGDYYIPKRGEIIVFHKQGLQASNAGEDKQLIKRVIGLPGERIVVREGVITIYNDEFPEGFKPDREGDYRDVIGTTSGNVDLTIPEGEVFVSGDNRDNSLDSRNFGTVSSDEIVGKLAVRIFPLDKFDTY